MVSLPIVEKMSPAELSLLIRDLLTDVLMCKEAWPFGEKGNEKIARILLGNEDKSYNFFVGYIGVRAHPWKYREKDAPSGFSDEYTPINLRGVVIYFSQIVSNDLNNISVISDISISVSFDDQTHMRNLVEVMLSEVVGCEEHPFNSGDKKQDETTLVVTIITEKLSACRLGIPIEGRNYPSVVVTDIAKIVTSVLFVGYLVEAALLDPIIVECRAEDAPPAIMVTEIATCPGGTITPQRYHCMLLLRMEVVNHLLHLIFSSLGGGIQKQKNGYFLNLLQEGFLSGIQIVFVLLSLSLALKGPLKEVAVLSMNWVMFNSF
ncbi:hypothetical protein V6N13_004988 [Hibiscus sabdariffa]